jgi:polar amino acid transport system substrate-binding protein
LVEKNADSCGQCDICLKKKETEVSDDDFEQIKSSIISSLADEKMTLNVLVKNTRFKEAKVLVLDRETACVLEVVQGRADAFIYDQMSVLKHYEQNPGTTRALLEAFQSERWAVGIRKGNEELRVQVNGFLKDFKGRGGFEELVSRWLGPQREAFRAAGIPFLF